MEFLWYFLSAALDTMPFIPFQYLPFRKKLRMSFGRTMLLCYIIMFFFAALFSYLSISSLYDSRTVYSVRLFQIIFSSFLTFILVKDKISKVIFVYCMVFPFISVLHALSLYTVQFIPLDAPKFMLINSVRTIYTLIFIFPTIQFWKKIFVPTVENLESYESTVWNYAWPVPTPLCLVELHIMFNNYQTNRITERELLIKVAVFACIIAINIFVYYVFNHIKEKIHLNEINNRNQLLIELQAEQYNALAESIEQTREARHDLRHHLKMIQAMLHEKDYDKIDSYVTEFTAGMPIDKRIIICENYAANAILSYFITKAEEADIDFSVNFCLAQNIPVKDSDLCVLLGNSIENAIEACSIMQGSNRFIRVAAEENAGRLYITVDNSFSGVIKKERETFLSAKRDYTTSGIGLSSIKTVAKKYDGDVKTEVKDNVFCLSVMLTLKGE